MVGSSTDYTQVSSDLITENNSTLQFASTSSLIISEDATHHQDYHQDYHRDPHDQEQQQQQQQQQQQEQQDLLATPHRSLSIALFALCTILLFADQNLLSPNLTAIAHDFGFDDNERDRKLGGDIALAFFVLGAPASYAVACLGDTAGISRTRLFAATVLLGEGACVATYFCSQSYRQLYVWRALTGISVGGALPLIYAILADYYTAPDERHAASALVGMGTGVGIALGQGVAGFLGPTFGWRLPFLVVGLPAVVTALAVGVWVPDPRLQNDHCLQHGQDIVEMEPMASALSMSSPVSTRPRPSSLAQSLTRSTNTWNWRPHWQALWTLLATPTVQLSLLQGPPGCLPWGVVNAYLNDFLAVDRGLTVEFATTVVLAFGLGNFAGMIVAGLASTWLLRRYKNARYPAILAGAAAAGACLPFWALLNWPPSHTAGSATTTSQSRSIILDHAPLLAIAVVAGTASGITGPIVKAQLQNVTRSHERGQAFALFNTTDDLGRGLGPVGVAWLIQRLKSRRPALNWAVTGWLVCGVLNAAVSRTIVRDERRSQNDTNLFDTTTTTNANDDDEPEEYRSHSLL